MTDYADMLARYKRMRGISRRLSKVLPDYLPKDAIQETAKRLGCWARETIVLGHIEQMGVVTDQAIHGSLRDGRNAVDRYAAEHPPAPGSDEEAVLRAMQRAFFSLFKMEGRVSGVGLHTLDLLNDCRYFLADIALSRCPVEGGILATRVVPFDDFIMTTGAGLPVDPEIKDELVGCLSDLREAWRGRTDITRQDNADMAARITRVCLRSEGAEQMRYVGVDEEDAADAVDTLRVGRNDPCPCGSGRKYKKCCGR